MAFSTFGIAIFEKRKPEQLTINLKIYIKIEFILSAYFLKGSLLLLLLFFYIQFRLDLQGQIVILDEAHNIEDVCREAASFTLNQDDIIEAKQDCDKIASYGVQVEIHKEMVSLKFRKMCKMKERYNLFV